MVLPLRGALAALSHFGGRLRRQVGGIHGSDQKTSPKKRKKHVALHSVAVAEAETAFDRCGVAMSHLPRNFFKIPLLSATTPSCFYHSQVPKRPAKPQKNDFAVHHFAKPPLCLCEIISAGAGVAGQEHEAAPPICFSHPQIAKRLRSEGMLFAIKITLALMVSMFDLMSDR
jgi:hypothetical protein